MPKQREINVSAPATPVLYLGKEERVEEGKFGAGWERDPNRINPHLQVVEIMWRKFIVFKGICVRYIVVPLLW